MSGDNAPRQLEAILDVLGLKADTLFEESEQAGDKRDKVVAWLYRVLDTLDSKTAQLLSFAALLLAAQTFLAQVIVGNEHTPHKISIWVLAMLVVPLGAGIGGLTVFAVQWRFFGHVRGPGEPAIVARIRRLVEKVWKPSAEKMPSNPIEHEMWELARVCDKRVLANWGCSVLCFCSVVVFAVTLVLAGVVIVRYEPHRSPGIAVTNVQGRLSTGEAASSPRKAQN